jgi:hypothetical protein
VSARGVRALALSGGGAALVLAAGALTLAPACGGESATLGIEQPIRVYACDARSVTTGPQFREGTLPDGAGAPNVIGVDISDRYLLQGQRGKKFSGSADPTARAVAIRLADVGTGYWVVPTRLVDPQTGNFTWEACVDFSREVAPGPHKLQLAAIDANGNFGKTFDDVELMVKSLVPTGKVVVSLRWDSDADLDLEVETPSGKTVDPKHPSTADKTDAGVDPTTPGAGKIDRDSNAACVLDGYRQEDLVFQGAPTAGTWLFRVNMFAACGAPAANFTLSVYVDGVLERTVPGRLVDTDANGGDGPGLFVTQLQF